MTLLTAHRVQRFAARAIPRGGLLIVLLTIATVPALAIGLAAAAEAQLGLGIQPPYPAAAHAVLLVAAPLAALLLVTAAASLRARHRMAREQREEAVRTNARLASVMAATEDAIVLLDLDGTIRGWNPAAERLFELPASDALGRRFESLVDSQDVAATREALLVVVAADRRVTSEGRLRRPDGTFGAITTWAAVHEGDDAIAGVSVLVRDAATSSHAEGRVAGTVARAAHAERRVRLLTDAALDAVIGMNAAGLVTAWNPAATTLFGLAEREAIGRPLAEVLVTSRDDSPLDGPGWLPLAGEGAIVQGRRADGSTFPAVFSIAAYEDGGRRSFTVFVHDVTARVDAEARAQEQESRYQSLVEHLPGVVYRARVGRWAPITYVSPHLEALLGYKPEEWVGIAGIWEEHIHPDDLQRVLRDDDAEVAKPGSRRDDREYRMRTRDGAELWVRDHADVERDADGNAVAWNGFLTDITERKRLEGELVRLAFHDPLTGLANRALLNDRIAHAIVRRHREQGTIAMLVIDIDDFKLVNDAHGHGAGDRLIVAAAERLRESIRADATIARLGGDEFAILLEGLPDDGAALVVAQRVVRAFDRPLRLEGMTISTRVSVGVAVEATGMRSAAWLLRSADAAMYEAKRLGKGRWHAYDPAAHLASAKRLVLESELRRAVERKQFVLVYQPIVDLRTEDIVGTEALIRWNHPTRGLVGPTEFISVLESTGLIEPVGRWVVDEACRQAAIWARQLPAIGWTAVNVSAAQLRSDAFSNAVRASLAEHDLAPERLTLEVTESLALDDSIDTVERLYELHSLGLRIAIDDFGTGYSSFAYLRRLPIDRLKIDRTFVDGLGSDPEADAVARAIVELATSLKLRTVAEGIEQRHQADAVRALGCELGQGFLFGRPLPAADLTALVVGRQAAAALRRAANEVAPA